MADSLAFLANCPVPDEFLIFVKADSVVAIHNANVMRTYVSVAYGELGNADILQKYLKGTLSYLPFRYIKPDLDVISPYCLTGVSDIRIETDAEMARIAYNPLAPSRLSAIFAFGDEATAQKASIIHGWDINTLRRTKLEPGPLTRVWKANMEIVSLMRNLYPAFSLDPATLQDVWSSNWSGQGNIRIMGPDPANLATRKAYESETTWEYLIEGRVRFLD